MLIIYIKKIKFKANTLFGVCKSIQGLVAFGKLSLQQKALLDGPEPLFNFMS